MNDVFLPVVLGVLAMGSGAGTAWVTTRAQRSKTAAESQAIAAGAAKSQTDVLSSIIDKVNQHVDRLEAQLDDANAEMSVMRTRMLEMEARLRSAELRFRDIPDAKPMIKFVDDGMLDAANRQLQAEGLKVRVGLYTDDYDGRYALGHQLMPDELVSPDQIPTPERSEMLVRRRADAAAEVRRSHGYDK